MMNALKTFETLIGTVCIPLSNNVHAHLLIFHFFFVSCLPQSSYVRMSSFLSHYWIPALWWVNDATVGVLLKCFAPISIGHVQKLIL